MLPDHRRRVLDPSPSRRNLRLCGGHCEPEPLTEPELAARRVQGGAGQAVGKRDEGGVARLGEVDAEGNGAGGIALEVLERLPANVDELRARHGVVDAQAILEQRRGAHHLNVEPGGYLPSSARS